MDSGMFWLLAVVPLTLSVSFAVQWLTYLAAQGLILFGLAVS